MALLAKARERRSSEQSNLKNGQKRSCGKREVERRACRRFDFNGRRPVRRCRCVVAVHERTERVVFHRNCRTRRVKTLISSPNELRTQRILVY